MPHTAPMPLSVYHFIILPLDDLPPDERECPICSCEYIESDDDAPVNGEALELSCGHVFGANCILAWADAVDHVTCPTCRHPLSLYEVDIDSDDEDGSGYRGSGWYDLSPSPCFSADGDGF